MTRRVVFDTSSLIGAALKRGSVPYRALALALDSFELCTSVQLLGQLESVLARQHFASLIQTEARLEFIELIRTEGRLIPMDASDMARVAPVCRDPSDDFILALASIAEADVIVSSDRDLLVLNPWNGIPILTPARFLAESESEDRPENP